MKIPEIKNKMKTVASEGYDSEIIKRSLVELKMKFLEENLESNAKEIWCLESIQKIQTDYIKAFRQLKNKRYYEAWCSFEQIELALNFLSPHFDINSNEYMLSFIDKHIRKYQKLYPYKIFMSPEILEHEKKCNICGQIISIRKPCSHEVGEIYNGEMCCRIVTKMDFLGIAMVESPLQKYSVPFIVDEKTGKSVDHYNYSLLGYLIERLDDPFEDWDFELTSKIYPHSHFGSLGQNDKCPCGSGAKYKRCCLQKNGIQMPHYEFIFPNGISEELQKGKVIY